MKRPLASKRPIGPLLNFSSDDSPFDDERTAELFDTSTENIVSMGGSRVVSSEAVTGDITESDIDTIEDNIKIVPRLQPNHSGQVKIVAAERERVPAEVTDLLSASNYDYVIQSITDIERRAVGSPLRMDKLDDIRSSSFFANDIVLGEDEEHIEQVTFATLKQNNLGLFHSPYSDGSFTLDSNPVIANAEMSGIPLDGAEEVSLEEAVKDKLEDQYSDYSVNVSLETLTELPNEIAELFSGGGRADYALQFFVDWESRLKDDILKLSDLQTVFDAISELNLPDDTEFNEQRTGPTGRQREPKVRLVIKK